MNEMLAVLTILIALIVITLLSLYIASKRSRRCQTCAWYEFRNQQSSPCNDCIDYAYHTPPTQALIDKAEKLTNINTWNRNCAQRKKKHGKNK
jgi:hypothetical protein